jgi:hypothetical protein
MVTQEFELDVPLLLQVTTIGLIIFVDTVYLTITQLGRIDTLPVILTPVVGDKWTDGRTVPLILTPYAVNHIIASPLIGNTFPGFFTPKTLDFPPLFFGIPSIP